MNKLSKRYGAILVGWIIAIVLAVVFMPNISSLLADKGQTKIPATAKSEVAKTMDKDWGHGISDTRQVVVVFNNGNHKLSEYQKENIEATIRDLKQNKAKYDIKKITAPEDSAMTEKQLISKDKSTQLVQLNVSKKKSVQAMNNQLKGLVKTAGVKTYVTGSDILNDDFRVATEEGVKKTEAIAIIFILIVLIIVFASPIVPLISLLTVGTSFLISLSITMNLADKFGLTISNFTQVFMVVVLFGIGTDYNILLYNQFKGDLKEGMSSEEATAHSMKVAGKTIRHSGISVLIGFAALGLAKFSIYQSAFGVAIGVLVLLLVLLTMNPFFMATFGKMLFWPSQNRVKTRESIIWRFLSKHSAAHPIIAIIIALILTVPFLATYNGNKLNYDDTTELANSLPSKQGYQVIQNHFSKGMAEPTTVYIRANHKLDNEADLKTIDNVTKQLQKEPGVKTVASVTQPGGEQISQLYVNDQLKILNSKMKTVQKGLKTIRKQSSQTKFDKSSLKAIGTSAKTIGSDLQQLQAKQASSSAQSEVASIQSAMSQAGHPLNATQQQIMSSAMAKQQSQMSEVSSTLQTVASETQTIGTNTQVVGNQLKTVQASLKQASAGLLQIEKGIKGASEYLAGLQKSAAANTFYIQDSVLKSGTFSGATNAYLSSDKKIAKLTVVLNTDPNSKQSMKRVDELNDQVKAVIKGTSLNKAEVAVGGQTATISDIKETANQDFLRTAVIMLIGITAALMLMTMSVLQPLYIIGTLVVSYFSALAITKFISAQFLGHDLLTWNTPFFTFVMLIALGVDYSIFLMTKYRELGVAYDIPSRRLTKAAAIIGTVVISAAIILGGTFAALIPSGVLTLIQVAIGVIVGLVFLVILIPIVVSSFIRLTYPIDDKLKDKDSE
ncbi:MMPL family transporter [Lentilactobacillus sp. Marseille-Q4993]|uniref:MMPL family transporter n=1 Tax=Lentilactobacillus sp. Marseille-Q4993 TaxID=3039492 RepID=UPI0024BD05D5|nr:MMPL family transporter [Lentilactobacillus sp. Marseille-Q4993]